MSYKPSVAIIGTSGFLGEPIIAALSRPDLKDKIQFPIKALTRDASTKKNTAVVEFVQADLTNEKSVIELLQGTDVILSLAATNPSLFASIEKIVKAVKPQVYIPSQFGTEIAPSQKLLPGFLDLKKVHSDNIRAAGIKTVDVFTSYFAKPGSFLYEIVAHAGIDRESNTVTYFGSPQTELSFSAESDIGNAVATLITVQPSKLPDTIKIQSGKVSFAQIAQKFEKDHGVKLTEKHVPADKILAEAQEKIAKSTNIGPDFLFYLHVIAAQGPDHGLNFTTDDNELVNPGGKLFSWSKY